LEMLDHRDTVTAALEAETDQGELL
jgi:hypothetical protein